MVNLIKGYDVSQIQGTINFPAIKASGAQFVICRCVVGNNGVDANYTKNIAGAKAAGLYTGAYNFLFPLPTTPAQPLRDPTKQAQYHFTTAQDTLAFADLEWPVVADWGTWGCSANQIVDWTLTYLQAYQTLSGMSPIIYTYPDFMQTIGNSASFAQYRLWIASYEATPTIPSPWNDWVMWQSSGGNETLPNSAVKVDVDYVKDLTLWLPAPPTVPPPPESSGSIPTVPSAPIPVVPPPPASSPPTVIQVPVKPSLMTLLWQVISGLIKSIK
jgi:lysozyme